MPEINKNSTNYFNDMPDVPSANSGQSSYLNSTPGAIAGINTSLSATEQRFNVQQNQRELIVGAGDTAIKFIGGDVFNGKTIDTAPWRILKGGTFLFRNTENGKDSVMLGNFVTE